MSILSKSLVPLTALVAALSASCANPSATPGPPGHDCSSPDPCECLAPSPGQTCVADGGLCRCTSAAVAESPEGGAPDASALDIGAFVGRWSPLSGSGQSSCAGVVNPLPPDTLAVLTFTQDGPSALTAASSGAAGCSLELRVEHGVAALARASEPCDVPGGGVVTFTTFRLAPPIAPAVPPGADSGALPDDAGTEAAAGDDDAGEDGGTSETDAGSPPSRDRLDWKLRDGDGTCTTTLDYTLVRVP